MKIYLNALSILLNVTSSIISCIENKSLEWQIIEEFSKLGSLLVLCFFCTGEGFLWAIWKFYNEKPRNAWSFIILFITMLFFRNEYLNGILVLLVLLLLHSLLLDTNFMEGFVKELCRFASIQNITISLIRLMLRPFEMCFTFIYRFGILVLLYIVLEEHVFHSCLTSIRPYWFKLKLSLSLQFTICLNCGRFLTGLESGHLDEEVSNNLRQHYAAIKILKNSDTNTMEKFLKELKAYIKCVTTLHLQK
ncbi:3373_t:CDS:2, partial [Rhizophagus irregularis]